MKNEKILELILICLFPLTALVACGNDEGDENAETETEGNQDQVNSDKDSENEDAEEVESTTSPGSVVAGTQNEVIWTITDEEARNK